MTATTKKPLDPRIGTLVREGKTIYYATLAGRTFEHEDVEAVQHQLEVADRQTATEPRKLSPETLADLLYRAATEVQTPSPMGDMAPHALIGELRAAAREIKKDARNLEQRIADADISFKKAIDEGMSPRDAMVRALGAAGVPA